MAPVSYAYMPVLIENKSQISIANVLQKLADTASSIYKEHIKCHIKDIASYIDRYQNIR